MSIFLRLLIFNAKILTSAMSYPSSLEVSESTVSPFSDLQLDMIRHLTLASLTGRKRMSAASLVLIHFSLIVFISGSGYLLTYV